MVAPNCRWPQRIHLIAFHLLFLAANAIAQPPEDQGKGPALSPAESAARFHIAKGLRWTSILTEPTIEQPLWTTHDSFGRLWVVEYRQYPEPAGIKYLSQDKFLRRIYDSIPLPPGHGGVPGADKITVHEDKDGDGVLETHTTFVEGLNIATSVVPTAEGAWVLNPPYLLFYADKNKDLQADGPPEVHLQGFGLEDTHSVVNSLCMGPDGWLYAAQGSTVSGSIKRFGSAEAPWNSMGQAIWRYHPTQHRYEIFAEGGGNAFGVAMNDSGEIFSGHNGGDTRGFHYYQGGYYRKGFSKHGSLSNPNSFGYLMPMKHDPIQRFTHTMLMTESTSMAAAMQNSMIAVDPLHGKLIQTELLPVGSTYDTRDVQDVIASDDHWFRPVAINDGPDGAAYVCDWYDFQVAHIYAFEGKMDREHGRIYKLMSDEEANATDANRWDAALANGTDATSIDYLIGKLEHPFRWQRWNARWLIAKHPLREERRDKILKRLDTNNSYTIEFLWTAHACGWLKDTMLCSSSHPIDIKPLLDHPNAAIRYWTVRLVCDDGQLSSNWAQAIGRLARKENDPKVLCQIACSAKRLSTEASQTIIPELMSRPLPDDDLFLPLLIWWAIEKHADDSQLILESLVARDNVWDNTIARKILFPNLVQRWCRSKSTESMFAASKLIQRVHTLRKEIRDDAASNVQMGFEKAFEGRSLAGVPDALIEALMTLGQPSLTLRLRRGDVAVLGEAANVIADSKQPDAIRIQLARITSELKIFDNKQLHQSLMAVALRSDDKLAVRSAAVASLAALDDPSIGRELIRAWATLPIELRTTAGAVLAARPSWTLQWLQACEEKQVDATELSFEAMRAMRMHADPELQKRVQAIYPAAATIDFASAQARSEKTASLVLHTSGDPYRGKKQYKELCARCHRLFDEGGNVGPDLTGYQRDQLQTLLRNIIAPSLEIREGYQTVRVLTHDGLVLSGFVESQNTETVILRGIDGESHSLERTDIDRIEPQLLSLMPEGILEKLSDQQVSDLMAYLHSSQPLNDG